MHKKSCKSCEKILKEFKQIGDANSKLVKPGSLMLLILKIF